MKRDKIPALTIKDLDGDSKPGIVAAPEVRDFYFVERLTPVRHFERM
ncbi:MAG: hypothetical protein O2887_08045 [Bacteroidetes bacterium]|nr:hypothetical protein [Bacteroidota bacterium]MDA1120430.1 hypothetical protein [Bacteroidota bacterium]